jgi:hypothetical protein
VLMKSYSLHPEIQGILAILGQIKAMCCHDNCSNTANRYNSICFWCFACLILLGVKLIGIHVVMTIVLK